MKQKVNIQAAAALASRAAQILGLLYDKSPVTV